MIAVLPATAEVVQQFLHHHYRGAADEPVVKGIGFPFLLQGSGEYVYRCSRRTVFGSHSDGSAGKG